MRSLSPTRLLISQHARRTQRGFLERQTPGQTVTPVQERTLICRGTSPASFTTVSTRATRGVITVIKGRSEGIDEAPLIRSITGVFRLSSFDELVCTSIASSVL